MGLIPWQLLSYIPTFLRVDHRVDHSVKRTKESAMLFFWYNKIGMLIVQGQPTRREIVFLKVDHQETKCLRQSDCKILNLYARQNGIIKVVRQMIMSFSNEADLMQLTFQSKMLINAFYKINRSGRESVLETKPLFKLCHPPHKAMIKAIDVRKLYCKATHPTSLIPVA